MKSEIESHIRAVDAIYRPLILPSTTRLTGGERLLAQFDQAVCAFRKYGRRQMSGVIERVNELAVARQLMLEPALTSAHIEYEPEIVTGPKFDFVIRAPGKATLYVEVKTVCPQIAINEASWRKAKYEPRRVVLDACDSSVEPPAQPRPSPAVGAAFMRYAIETGAKLDAHNAVERGYGALIYCGDGLSWDAVDVEAFAAVYRETPVRFGVMIRPQDAVEPLVWAGP